MATIVDPPQQAKTTRDVPPTERASVPGVAWLVLAAGLVAWLISYFDPFNLTGFSPWGGLPRVTLFWYVGLLAAAAVCGYGVVRRGPPPTALLTAGFVLLTVILYRPTSLVEQGTAGTVAGKDLQATRHILEQGSVDTALGLDHRWPGGSALSALLTELTGASDPSQHGVWLRYLFGLLLALLVYGLANRLSTDKRAGWAAVLVFSGLNWIAQLQSPAQPLALALHLGVLLLVLRFFRCPPNRIGRRIEKLLGERALGRDFPGTRPTSDAVRNLAFAVILLVHGASTVAHPLAPVVTVLAVAILVLLGYVRSWWLLGALAAITVGYLIPNLAFLRLEYSAVNLNATDPRLAPIVFFLVTGVLTVLAIVARWQHGRRPALTCAALVLAPTLLGLAQNQGGEARFQTLWFALPWCSIVLGWLLARTAVNLAGSDRPRLRVPPAAVTPRPSPARPPVGLAARPVPTKGWEPKAPVVLSLTLVAGVLTALLSLRLAATRELTDYGLLPVLPLAWYAGLALLVVSAAAVMALGKLHAWLAALHVFALIVVLYGSGVILAEGPRFAWSYKHIGVTRYITQYGTVDPDIDIYHRWPGFFSLSALYGSVAGLPNPLSYAAWTGVAFVVLQAMLVVAIARTLLKSLHAAWAAGLVFVCINWVGQDYFAPQPFAFALALGVLWLTLVHFKWAPSGRLARLCTRFLSTVARMPDEKETGTAPDPLWGRRTALAVIIVLYAAIVPSHQLTPYFVVLILAGLAVTNAVRPRWIPAVLFMIAVAFLVPNFGYVQQNFNVFSGLDPFSNAQPVNSLDRAQPGKVFNVRSGFALSLTFSFLAMLALLSAWRQRTVTAFHAAVAFAAPFSILLTQNYGGEGSLRVILFAAPWAAILIAASLMMRGTRRAWVLAPVMAVLVTMFLPAYYGVEELNRIPPGEVVASDFLYANGVPGSIVVSSAPNFPLRVGERYPLFRGPRNDADPVLTRGPRFRNRALGPADVDDVVNVIRRYGNRGYVIFSDSQETYATVFGVTTPADLRSLEAALLSSGQFQVFYENDTTRIYELEG